MKSLCNECNRKFLHRHKYLFKKTNESTNKMLTPYILYLLFTCVIFGGISADDSNKRKLETDFNLK